MLQVTERRTETARGQTRKLWWVTVSTDAMLDLIVDVDRDGARIATTGAPRHTTAKTVVI